MKLQHGPKYLFHMIGFVMHVTGKHKKTRPRVKSCASSEHTFFSQFQKYSLAQKLFSSFNSGKKLKKWQMILCKLHYHQVHHIHTISISIASYPRFLGFFSWRNKCRIFIKSMMLSKAHVDHRICTPFSILLLSCSIKSIWS